MKKKYVINSGEKSHWSSIIFQDSIIQVYKMGYNIDSSNVYEKLYIRPVINLKKSVINRACYINNINQYLYCDFGEEVTYDNQNYYVLEESNSAQKYVTLLKKEPLTASEVNLYSVDYVSQNGEYPFCLNADGCRGMTYGSYNYKFDYSDSDVKKIVDKWSIKYKKDLVNINKIETRLMTIEKLNDNFDYRNNQYTDLTPPWIYLNIDKYWSMSSYDHSYFTYTSFIEEGIYGISSSLTEEEIDNNLLIRPVINLKKTAIESGCTDILHTKYSIGDNISYNNENYCVIKNSNVRSDYVTLIKQNPLTYDELLNYKGNLSTDYFQNSNGVGLTKYYSSDVCNSSNLSGCNSSYNTSFVKTVIDSWSSSNISNNNLIEVNGYKTRLINVDDLFENLGYDRDIIQTNNVFIKTENVPDCMSGSIYNYWTMSPVEDVNYKLYYISNYDGKVIGNIDFQDANTYIYKQNAVRPVINLKKCAITNTCE